MLCILHVFFPKCDILLWPKLFHPSQSTLWVLSVNPIGGDINFGAFELKRNKEQNNQNTVKMKLLSMSDVQNQKSRFLSFAIDDQFTVLETMANQMGTQMTTTPLISPQPSEPYEEWLELNARSWAWV